MHTQNYTPGGRFGSADARERPPLAVAGDLLGPARLAEDDHALRRVLGAVLSVAGALHPERRVLGASLVVALLADHVDHAGRGVLAAELRLLGVERGGGKSERGRGYKGRGQNL